tara:strand:- start:98 stop:736 length:639 start_codon:yes stop_codon:yes gene_type:complete
MKEKETSFTEPIIIGLFPTPIYSTFIKRKFTKQELNFIKRSNQTHVSNHGNTTSKNNYILELKEFKKLKLELEDVLKDYMEKIYSPTHTIKCYITQSWLNYTKLGQHHHVHSHPNSFLSGILYINADKNFDRIYFHKDNYEQLKITTKNFNIYNSESWWLSIETGKILIFPSWVRHSVAPKKEEDTRISLSFNTFLKGDLGTAAKLTEIKLN